MRIYVQNLSNLTLYFLITFVISIILLYIGRQKRMTKLICGELMVVAFYGILHYTVLGRTCSMEHAFVWTNSYNSEFYRELFMNALLYYPLGLTLTVLIGPWSILVAFVLSLTIETWQYFAGTGLAQGTDVLMNTLGCAIGALPWLIVRWKDN